MSKQRTIPVPLVITLVLLFTALGGWQLQRLEWKNNLIAMAEAHHSQPPLNIVTQGDLPADIPLFYHVGLQGQWLHDHALTVVGRYENKVMGRHVVTPLQLAGGTTLLVNRGWVAEGTVLPIGAEAATIRGVIVPTEGEPSIVLPNHRPEKNDWISIDVDAMVAHLQAKGVASLPLLVQQTVSQAGEPQAQPFELRFWNQHKEYAIMWFAIALATVVMQIVYMRKNV